MSNSLDFRVNNGILVTDNVDKCSQHKMCYTQIVDRTRLDKVLRKYRYFEYVDIIMDVFLKLITLFTIYDAVWNEQLMTCSRSMAQASFDDSNFAKIGCLLSDLHYIQMIIFFYFLMPILMLSQNFLYKALNPLKVIDSIVANGFKEFVLQTRAGTISKTNQDIKNQQKKIVDAIKAEVNDRRAFERGNINFDFLRLLAFVWHIVWIGLLFDVLLVGKYFTNSVEEDTFVYGDDGMFFECNLTYDGMAQIMADIYPEKLTKLKDEKKTTYKVTCIRSHFIKIIYISNVYRIICVILALNKMLTEIYIRFGFNKLSRKGSNRTLQRIVLSLIKGCAMIVEAHLVTRIHGVVRAEKIPKGNQKENGIDFDDILISQSILVRIVGHRPLEIVLDVKALEPQNMDGHSTRSTSSSNNSSSRSSRLSSVVDG